MCAEREKKRKHELKKTTPPDRTLLKLVSEERPITHLRTHDTIQIFVACENMAQKNAKMQKICKK
jgi:hypothetical protein